MASVFRGDREQELTAAFLPAHGFFVEVGAYEPITYSQTFHLEQAGWRGLLIEPVPTQAKKLKDVRRAQVIAAACGSPEQHGRTLKLFCNGQQSSLVHQTDNPISVPVFTLDSMLARTRQRTVDFLSVDVEGAELDVLQGFSFSRYRPKLILLEDFAEDFTRHNFMRRQGYKRVRRTGNNSWYVPQQTHFALSFFDRLQLLRKYYLSVPFRKLRHFRSKTPQ